MSASYCLIFAAEVIYRDSVTPLVQGLKRLATPDTTILVVNEDHTLGCIEEFVQTAFNEGFQVAEVHHSLCHFLVNHDTFISLSFIVILLFHIV